MADNDKVATLGDLRVAFEHGASWAFRTDYKGCGAPAEARHRYPSPKKLREVLLGDFVYRARNGVLEFACIGYEQWERTRGDTSVSQVRALADLLDHPYEDSGE